MNTIIERNRNRLIEAKLHDLVRRTGTYLTAITLSDGTIQTAELSADILTKALKKLFEARVYAASSKNIAEGEITRMYSACIKLKTGELTDIGEGFMNALISNLVEKAFKNKG